jgi:hypothetical protein
MIYYTLNKNIVSEKLISDIQKLLDTIHSQDLQNSCLVISIQKINDYAGDSPVPKITYQGNCPT